MASPIHTPPLTHRAVLAIAVPLILSNVTTPLIGLVDTAVVGQLGAAHYIGAVALGGAIFNFLFWAFGFLRVGTTGLAAQADGAADGAETAATLGRALVIAGAAGVAMVLLQRPIAALSFAVMGGSDAVTSEARTYFDIRIWSAPFALANYALAGWFVGLGRARTALFLQVFVNGLNAALDALFVLAFGWATAGVAAGTLIAEVAAALAGVYLAWRILGERGGFDPARVFRRDGFVRALAVNGDIMIRTVCLLFAFTFFVSQSAAQGDVLLAANAVLIQFVSVSAYLLDGFAYAAATLTGRAIGGRDRKRFREAVYLSSVWAGALAVLLALATLAGGGALTDLLTVNPAVREAARVYLIWAAFVPAIGAVCYQFDGVFMGATRSADMRDMALVSVAVFLAAWAILTPVFGNHGLWASLAILNAARGATLAWRYPALVRDSFGAARVPAPS